MNTITTSQYSFKVAKNQRPFSNNFTQISAAVVQYRGVDEIKCVVLCTKNSKEPGREYSCIYSIKGELIACITLN